MSLSEILDELPKLSSEERQTIFQKLGEIELGEFEETPEMLAAIDEATATPLSEGISADEMLRRIKKWTSSK